MVIYLAGADRYRHDRFERHFKQSRACRPGPNGFAGLPVAITMAGGYAPNIQDTVDIHFNTIRIAAEFQRSYN